MNNVEYVELADRLLETYTLRELLYNNDLEIREVIAHLISCGLIEIPETVALS